MSEETCSVNASVDQNVIMKKSKIDQIQTLAYVVSLLHSHKTFMDGSMMDEAMLLSSKCLKAAIKMADTLEDEG